MASADAPRIAVYSPAKTIDDPLPSGERTILRQTLAALRLAGFAPGIVSALRLIETRGDACRQAEIARAADAEATRLIGALRPERPALWYTYQTWYRCPDLVGPVVSRALGIPYVIQQPSLSPKRMAGPWAGFARAAHAAIMGADLLLWTTRRDLPALREAGLGGRLVELPPVVDSGPPPEARPARSPLRLLTVAMMRDGAKTESYLALAAALCHLAPDWRLRIAGDGPARPTVEAAFARFGERVSFLGALTPERITAEYAHADLLVWPGIGEGVGMAYLEAQAVGVPVIAEAHAAQGDVVEGPLVPPGDPAAFAAAIAAAASGRPARSAAARVRIEARHTPEAAAAILRPALAELIR